MRSSDEARARGKRRDRGGKGVAGIRSRSGRVAAIGLLAACLAGLGVTVVTVAVPSGIAAGATVPAPGWTTAQAPLPSDAGNGSTNPNVYLASSACPAPSGCITVGWYDDTSVHAWGLIETQNGSTWTDTQAPQPGNAGTGIDQGLFIGSQQCGVIQVCHAISCPSPTFCVAVGGYYDSAAHMQPLLETSSNGTWTAAEAPVPGDTATDSGPTVFPNAYLFAVSCISTTSCVAVGQYTNTSGAVIGLVDTLSGTTWTTTFAVPGSVSSDSFVYDVSCVASGFCAATGYYRDNSTGNPFNGLILQRIGGTWTAQRAPEPPNGGTDGDGHQFALATGVSCASASACTAVGRFDDTSGHARALVDTWNGTNWIPTDAPLPSDAGTLNVQLDSVSCASASFCAAVGLYTDTNAETWGLVVTISNGVMTAQAAPQPANAQPESNQAALLFDVTCPSSSFCAASGSYRGLGPATRGYIVSFNGADWSSIEAPVPSDAAVNGTSYSLARTVACFSPTTCTSDGYYQSGGHSQGFLDSFTALKGYWLAASDGGVFNYGNAQFYGSAGSLKLNKPVVGMAATPDAQGYWLVASDGGIFNYGDAGFFGSTGGLHLNQPVVGMASTPDGQGYWLVASDGGIFNYGDAGFFGSRGGQPLNKPIVGVAATADGQGYWLVASDGGIFGYGDATFYGSTGGLVLNKPVVGMATSPDGHGYWLVASDGGIFNYGNAPFEGSAGGLVLNKPVVGMAATSDGAGYWLGASDGGIFNYGDALFYGSAGGMTLNAPVVGMAGG